MLSIKHRRVVSRTAKAPSVLVTCTILALAAPVFSLFLYFVAVKQTKPKDCPLVLDLNGNESIDVFGLSTTRWQVYSLIPRPRFVEFSIGGRGEKTKVSWLKPNTDGFLLDLRRGTPPNDIDGTWLFANSWLGDEFFQNGFEKLNLFDKDQDGIVTGDELNNVAVWVDDGDALFEERELHKLSEYNIESINVGYNEEDGPFGGKKMVGVVTKKDGSRIYMEDVWFMGEDDMQDSDIELYKIFGT